MAGGRRAVPCVTNGHGLITHPHDEGLYVTSLFVKKIIEQ